MNSNREQIPMPPENWQTDNEVFENIWEDLLKIQEEAYKRKEDVLNNPLKYFTVVD
jgi:hypothetical protein